MAKRKAEVENRCAALREALGCSAAELARAARVTRQTIYAIEAGKYLPNAIVALRLARALETTVEELFRLADDRRQEKPGAEHALLLSEETLRSGQTVQLGRVGERLVAASSSPVNWTLPPADGVIAKNLPGSKSTMVQPFHPSRELENRVVMAGCDPGMSILARHAQAAGIELILVHRNSTEALELLRKGCVHIAGSHLRDAKSSDLNLPHVERTFPKQAVAVVSFAWWEAGLVTARANPKKIKTIPDLARPDVCFINREVGSGARVLLDQELTAAGIPRQQVHGYGTSATGHLEAAYAVTTGEADCCIATRAAAQRFGLGFVPLARERYDFVLRRRDLESAAIQTLLDAVAHSKLRRELSLLGYETAVCGERQL